MICISSVNDRHSVPETDTLFLRFVGKQFFGRTLGLTSAPRDEGMSFVTNRWNNFVSNRNPTISAPIACLKIKHRTSATKCLGGNRCKIPGPDYVVYIFVFLDGIIVSRLHKLTISDHAQVTLHTEGLSDVAQSFLAGPPLLGGPKTFYHPGPKPLSAGLCRTTTFYAGTEWKVCCVKYWWEYSQQSI